MLKLSADNLRGAARTVHAFFGRSGGVSTALYASLNCGPGSNDDRTNVIENRRIALAALGSSNSRLLTLYQVHGAETVEVCEAWDMGRGPKDIHTHLIGDLVIVRLKGVLTAAELRLTFSAPAWISCVASCLAPRPAFQLLDEREGSANPNTSVRPLRTRRCAGDCAEFRMRRSTTVCIHANQIDPNAQLNAVQDLLKTAAKKETGHARKTAEFRLRNRN